MDLEYRHALAEISALEQGLTGVLRIGAGPVWITMLLPPVIASFFRQYPKVKTRLTGGVIDTLVPDLLSGDIDIVCSTLDFPSQPEIIKEPLLFDPPCPRRPGDASARARERGERRAIVEISVGRARQ